MQIRRATEKDIDRLNALLRQVLKVHHNGRPDIFKDNAKKYTDAQLKTLLKNDETPIFVACEDDFVVGYAFCVFIQHKDNNILTDIKTLYIDDLCVDESERGKHIGSSLYDFVVEYAKASGCYNVTLNVWCCNTGALEFYKKLGLTPQKINMEKIL